MTTSLGTLAFPSERQPERAEDRAWERVERLVRSYAWLTLVSVVLGVAVAHKVVFTGRGWPTCGVDSWCTAAIHLYEVPLVLYIAGVALYGLFRFTRSTRHRYDMLVGFSSVVQLVFAGFEVQMLLTALREHWAAADAITLAAVTGALLVGAALGWVVRLRIGDNLWPPVDTRFEHPATERDIVSLVKRASAEGRKVRVRGAEHSVNTSIYADEVLGAINIQLDRYVSIVRWDPARRRVTVQAGCHLGVDPRNPTSTQKNSLLWQLERRGWALPDLGGITHQTVGGFLSTGSAGGTTKHDFAERVVGIRLIDGGGEVHDLAPDPANPNDESENDFYAAGVSMGLLGIISEVTFECELRYDIIGSQDTTSSAGCAISLFEKSELEAFFEQKEYSRLLWWPQDGVDRVQVWQARRTAPADDSITHRNGAFEPKPFVSLPGGAAIQAIIKGFYELVSQDAPPYEAATAGLVRAVLNTVLRDDSVRFWDYWHTGLPMDNQISDTFMPTEFTELFIDIAQTDQVMLALKGFYASDAGMERTGPYACEIYPARRSRFWLSPSYGRDSVRIDIFWFKTRRGSPELDFYPRYWELLRPFNFRFHWGKYLSEPASTTGLGYISRQYPKWNKFMEVRERFDPAGTFLTDYWRGHLGL